MTAREARMEHTIKAWDALGKAGRDVKRALAHERARNPLCDLTHRGAWLIRDTKATPPDLTNAPQIVRRLGAWGYDDAPVDHATS